MNRKWWKFLFLLPISVCTLYAGGYAAQFIKNYQEWTSAGNFAGNGTYPQAASLHPLVCFHTALTDFPYNLYGIFLCLVLFGLLTFLLMRMGYDRNGEISDHDRNLNYSTKGTYGTSGFMTPDEMMKVLELTGDVKKNKGTILGKLNGKAVCLPYQTRMNKKYRRVWCQRFHEIQGICQEYDFPVCRQRAGRQQRFRGKFNHYRSQKRTL